MTGKLRNMTSIYLLKDDKVLLLFRKGGRVEVMYGQVLPEVILKNLS